MAKKVTYPFVKSEIEKEGYVLLSKEYINNRTKLALICSAGHEYMVCWDKWQQGRRCPYCAKNSKLSYDFVKKQFEKEGYVLLSEEYVNAQQKLDFICPNGHRHNITWGMFQTGNRCVDCSCRPRIFYKNIKEAFELEGYVLLSTEYRNNKQKLAYICPNGHTHTITYNRWGGGSRCPSCSEKNRLTYSFVKEQLEKEGYVLLSKKFINTKHKLKCMCPEGHTYSISWRSWKRGSRCPYCSGRLL